MIDSIFLRKSSSLMETCVDLSSISNSFILGILGECLVIDFIRCIFLHKNERISYKPIVTSVIQRNIKCNQ
jgi:hypothetical protein